MNFYQVWEQLLAAVSAGYEGMEGTWGGAGTGLNVKKQNCPSLKDLSAPRNKEGFTSFIVSMERSSSPDTWRGRESL